ncbi:MAG: hypothetical protein CVV02_09250 [Firmicutes bacterium HGW-Firmicutes-7]|nr:MAG: hypothetical protein CVV02_09250 [Firmicutes bacterium HGW-Firmicutes-7]
MKKFSLVMGIVCVVLLIGINIIYASNTAEDEKKTAAYLKEIGVFVGSNSGFELDRKPTRIEGIVLLIRLLGKEGEVLAEKNISSSFNDVPQWAIPYAEYAYSNGITKGIGKGKFGSAQVLSAAEYMTFVLRALGYDDSKGDFSWDNSVNKAVALGIIDKSNSSQVINSFDRGKVVLISHKALQTKKKGTNIRLIDELVTKGYIDVDKLGKAGFLEKSSGTELNILDFGAIPNDGGDDSDAIRTAMFVLEKSNYNTIFIPNGVFDIGSTIILKNGVIIRGGEETTLLVKANIKQLFDISKCSNVTMKDMKIDNNGYLKHYVIFGVSTEVKENITIHNITSVNGGYNFLYTKNIKYFKVTNNKVYNTFHRGMNMYNPYDILVEGNLVDTTQHQFGISIEGGNSSVFEQKKIVVKNNTIKNVEDGGLAIRALNSSLADISVMNNTILNVGKAGIKVTIEVNFDGTKISNIKVSDNVINGFANNYAEAGITVSDYNGKQNVYNAEIVNNLITGGGKSVYGIRVQNSKDIKVNQNTIKGTFLDSGLLFEGSAYVLAANNIIEDSAVTHYAPYQGGILVSMSNNITLDNNTVKNSGSKDNKVNGILIYRSSNNVVKNNTITDTRNEPFQLYPIFESDGGGPGKWSENNTFINNSYSSNYYDHAVVTDRSKIE